MSLPTFEDIAETAMSPARNWTNLQVAQFHAWNPNGLVARKRANDNRIAEMVDAGTVKSGWHLVYGSFANYEERQIIELAQMKRPRRIALQVAIESLRRHCEQQEAKINEVNEVAA